jgi:hypothetical protein
MIDQYPSANGVLTSLIWRKTMSGGETSLSGYDNASQALSYTPGQEQVYLNGILLVRGDDYTATNGTSITGLAALAASDFVQINCYNNFSVATTPATSITGEITNSQITSLATSKLTGTITNAQLAGSISNDKLSNSSITINGSAVSLGGSATIAGGSAQDSEPTSPTEGQLWLDTNGTLATTAFVEKSTINAKGDLYVGTANDTVEILSTTENGATIVADSSTSTGLRYQANFAAGKNAILNGDFRINQRAFTSTTSSGYNFDRWTMSRVNGTVTVSTQTFTLGAAPVAGYEGTNFCRVDVTGQSAAGDLAIETQFIESVRSFAGQTVTVSLWAKTNAAADFALNFYQYFGTGGSPSSVVEVTGQKTATTTNWTRYSFTFAIPSISGKTIGTNNNDYLALRIWASAGSTYNSQTDSLGTQTVTLDIWGVQVEAGSTATAFQTATGTIQGELAACQRYYFRRSGGSLQMVANSAVAYNSTTSSAYIQPPQVMRAIPTSFDAANIGYVQYDEAGPYPLSSLVLNGVRSTESLINIYGTVSGVTAGRFGSWAGTAAGAYLGFSAEL